MKKKKKIDFTAYVFFAVMLVIYALIALGAAGFFSQPTLPICKDSDSSALQDSEMSGSVYVKGEVESGQNSFVDYCDGNTVYEYTCMPDDSIGAFPFKCKNGCSKGECIWL